MAKRVQQTVGSDDIEPSEREAPQRSIQSVEFGFRLIRALEEAPGSLALKELSARADMAASKAHLYLVSFRRVGLVAQEEHTGRYTLGSYALELGLSSLRKLDVARLARAPLQDLSDTTGEASYLAVWGNRGPAIILRVDGPRPTPMSLQVGYVLPTASTATGRIFLSYLPRGKTQEVVEAERGKGASRPQDYDETNLDRIIAETRARGIARTDSLLNIGFTALSCPIHGHDGNVVAAMTLIGPSSGMDASLTGTCARQLRRTTDDLSAQLGWKTPV